MEWIIQSRSRPHPLEDHQALRLFRGNDWTSEGQRIPAIFTVRIEPPVMEHRARTRDFETSLNSGTSSPTQMAVKNRLREILDRWTPERAITISQL